MRRLKIRLSLRAPYIDVLGEDGIEMGEILFGCLNLFQTIALAWLTFPYSYELDKFCNQGIQEESVTYGVTYASSSNEKFRSTQSPLTLKISLLFCESKAQAFDFLVLPNPLHKAMSQKR
jgi:hypothetical protein